MTIFINIIWSILLILFFLLLTCLFTFKIDSGHSFLSVILGSAGAILMVCNSIPNNEMFLVWIGIFLMAIFFNGTFISALAISLQATLLSMYGLSMLPNFAYTWTNIVTSAILSKVGAVLGVVFVVLFLIGLLANDDNKKSENHANIDYNENNNNNKDFKFASFYIKGYDESVRYSLYSSGNNWATLKDENGNTTNVHIWNEGDRSLEDDVGNIYRPL